LGFFYLTRLAGSLAAARVPLNLIESGWLEYPACCRLRKDV